MQYYEAYAETLQGKSTYVRQLFSDFPIQTQICWASRKLGLASVDQVCFDSSFGATY